jgi:DNA integrity scanning protein DisA with diadenylate cyclase activity
MTSLRAPDYAVKVDNNAEINKKLRGLSGTFSITLISSNISSNIKCAISGMVIIFQLDEKSNYREKLQINLWIDSKKVIMPINEKVLITLNEACEPMHHDQEALRSVLPVSFYGEITHL